jgi:Tfp pilus assembly protein PilF
MSNTYFHEELFYSADNDIKDGFLDAAVQKLEQIIEEDPSFGKAYNHLGWLNETKFKNYPEAERFYKLAITHAPNYSAGFTNYAFFLSSLHRFDELQILLDSAINVPGIDKSTIYNEYGIMFELKEQFETAIDYYKKCIKATLNKDTMNLAMESIERCKTKMSL